jgi:hypothetical protein
VQVKSASQPRARSQGRQPANSGSTPLHNILLPKYPTLLDIESCPCCCCCCSCGHTASDQLTGLDEVQVPSEQSAKAIRPPVASPPAPSIRLCSTLSYVLAVVVVVVCDHPPSPLILCLVRCLVRCLGMCLWSGLVWFAKGSQQQQHLLECPPTIFPAQVSEYLLLLARY